jgi:hypothetical protein
MFILMRHNEKKKEKTKHICICVYIYMNTNEMRKRGDNSKKVLKIKQHIRNYGNKYTILLCINIEK